MNISHCVSLPNKAWFPLEPPLGVPQGLFQASDHAGAYKWAKSLSAVFILLSLLVGVLSTAGQEMQIQVTLKECSKEEKASAVYEDKKPPSC